MSEMTLADSLRSLADLIDEDVYLAEAFAGAQFGRHLFSGDSTLIDAFVKHFGGARTHASEGRTYMTAEAEIGPLKVWCQTYEDDYENTALSGEDAPA